MASTIRTAAAVLAALFAAGTALAKNEPAVQVDKSVIARLAPIRIDTGINRVVRFSADGRPAIITSAWRDSGTSAGYTVRVAMMPSRVGAGDWRVIGIDRRGRHFEDVLSDDDPKGGQRSLSSMRFAHAVLDGAYETILLVATRETGLFTDPDEAARVTYDVYKLVRSRDSHTEYFTLVASLRSQERYCDAEVALSRHFSIPLVADYRGPRTVDGCATTH